MASVLPETLSKLLARTFSRRSLSRGLISLAGTGYLGAILYPVVRYLESGAGEADAGPAVTEISLGPATAFPDNSGKNVAFGRDPALVIRSETGNFTAFIATCTHLGCTVAYQPAQLKIRCPCHGGAYDPVTGRNTGGPPPAPLTVLLVAVEAGNIVVRRPGTAAAPQAGAAPGSTAPHPATGGTHG